MNRSDFDAFVQRQRVGQQEKQAPDPKRQLSEWLDHLADLYEQITKFLESYTKDGSASIEYKEVQLNEEFIGAYSTRSMKLQIGRSVITFTPIGTMLIGTKGRVDVQGPLNSARLCLIDRQVTSARQLIKVTIVSAGEPRNAVAPQEAKKPDWVWKLVSPPPEMRFIELTQETFFDMILSVADA